MRLLGPALILGIAAWAAPILGGSAQAQDVQYTSFAELSSLMHEQNDRIAQLEARLASHSTGGTTISDGSGGCGCNEDCGCDSCCDQSGWYAGAEIVALKVFQSEGNLGNNDYQPGTRLWLGAQRSDGLGLRLRWFDYTQTIDNGDVDIENLDLEITDSFVLGNWSGLVSGGVRYTDYRVDEDAGGDQDVDISATGITFGLQANRALRGPLSIFAAVQESIMFGKNRIDDENVTFAITELQLGLQADRCLESGGTMFFRTGVEGQFYCASDDDDSESLGLFGFFATVGVMR